jgi:hypothetical protein
LVKSLGSNYIIYRKIPKYLRSIGAPEYYLIFENQEMRLNLAGLLSHYKQVAQDAGLTPVVVFLPRNQHDTSSAAGFIERYRAEFGKDLLLGNLGQSTSVDWEKFNLLEPDGENTCHPSSYGYQKIAEYVATLLHDNEILPADENIVHSIGR